MASSVSTSCAGVRSLPSREDIGHESVGPAVASTAAIRGHPVHPMLLPVPIGLYAGAAGADLAYLLTGDPFWARAARWLLRGALISGSAAAAPGLIDFVTLPPARRPAGWVHGLGNASALLLTLPNLAIRRMHPRRVTRAGLALTLGTNALLVLTGWLGGELSYRYGLGVQPDDRAAPRINGRITSAKRTGAL